MATLNEIRGKLIGFAYLSNGWHYNQGVPAKEHTLKTALMLLSGLEEAGFHYTDAYPGIDGSVMISAYDLPDSYDFNVKPSGLITVAHDRESDDLFYQEGMTVDGALGKIKDFGASKCHTSDYLISGTTTAGSTDDLKATPSRTQKTAQEFPSLTSIAPDVNPAVFVNTLPTFIIRPLERQSFSGKSRTSLFQTIGT